MPKPPDYKVPHSRGEIGRLPIAANVQFGQNELVFRNAEGHAVPWSANSSLIPIGVAAQPYDNAGGPAGAFEVEVLVAGTFGIPISANDPVTTADVSTLIHAAGPNLVARTNDNNTRPAVGKLREIHDNLAWISFV